MGNIAGTDSQWLWGRDPRQEFPSTDVIRRALTGMQPGAALRLGDLGIVRDASGRYLLDDETVRFLARAGIDFGPKASDTTNRIAQAAATGYSRPESLLPTLEKWGQLPVPRRRTTVAVSPFDLSNGVTEEMAPFLGDYLAGFGEGSPAVRLGDLTTVRSGEGRLLFDPETQQMLAGMGIPLNRTMKAGGYKTAKGFAQSLVGAPLWNDAPAAEAAPTAFPDIAYLNREIARLRMGEEFNLGPAKVVRDESGWVMTHPQFRGKLGAQANVYRNPTLAAAYLDMLGREDVGRYFPGYAAPPAAAPPAAPVAAAVDSPASAPPARVAATTTSEPSPENVGVSHTITDEFGNAVNDQLGLFPAKAAALGAEGSPFARMAQGFQAGWLDALRDNPKDLQELFLGPFSGIQTQWAKERISSLGGAGRIGGAAGNMLAHAVGLWPLRILWRAHPYDMASTMGPAAAADATGLAKGHSGFNQRAINEEHRIAELGEESDAAFNRPLGAQIDDDATKPFIQLGDLHLLKLDPKGHLPNRIAAPLGAGIAFATALGSSNVDLGNLFNLQEGPRARGYKAALANQDDPTKTMFYPWALVEGVFAGGSSRPLDWNRFHQERPEVTRQQYDAYDRYNKGIDAEEGDPASFSLMGGLVKGTSSNLEGTPELRIMGGRITPVGVGVGAIAAGIGASAIKDYVSREYDKAMAGGRSSLEELSARDDVRRSTYYHNVPAAAYDPAPETHWFRQPFMKERSNLIRSWQGKPLDSYTPEARRQFMAALDEVNRQEVLFGGRIVKDPNDPSAEPTHYRGEVEAKALDPLKQRIEQDVSSRLSTEGTPVDETQLSKLMGSWSKEPAGRALRRGTQIEQYYSMYPKAAAQYFPERPTAESLASAYESVVQGVLKNVRRIA